MKILLVAATALEIAPLLQKLEIIEPVEGKVYSLAYRKNGLDILCCGVGPVVSAFHTTVSVQTANYGLVINVGVGGSMQRSFAPGELVQIEKDRFGEFGAENGNEFLDLFALGLAKGDEGPYKKGYLCASEVPNTVLDSLAKAEGLTCSISHGNADSVKLLEYRYPTAQVQSMEGASILYVCNMLGVRCIQLRSISNYVEKRDRTAWKMKEAIDTLNTFTLKLLDSF